MLNSRTLSLLALLTFSACSEPGQEAEAREWLLTNGYEVTSITSTEAGAFQFTAIQQEKRCSGTLNISTGSFGSTSHMRTCTDNPTEQDLQTECATGRVQSCHELGLHKMESDPAMGLELFVRACEGGVAAACTNAGVMSARAQPRNGPQAVAYARRGCAGADAQGCDNLGIYLVRGFHGDISEPDKVEGRRLLEEGCARDNNSACGILGWELAFGQNFPHDDVRARTLLTQACENDGWGACGDLGLLYRDGRGGDRDLEQALTYVTQACTQASIAMSCRVQGGLISERQGREFSAEALAAFQRGCASTDRTTHVGAACDAAGSYLFQVGNSPNPQPIAALLGRACELGNRDGCHHLGMLHASTRFGPANMPLAQQFMQRACQMGREDSCRLAQ